MRGDARKKEMAPAVIAAVILTVGLILSFKPMTAVRLNPRAQTLPAKCAMPADAGRSE